MRNIVFDKFQDLKKKANFWFEIIKLLPSICPVQCWKICFEKSFAAQEKLWNFQQENRKLLDTEQSFNREQIGDIAWNIASIYLHYYIRFISKDYLKRSILFFEAIVERGYFDEIKTTEKYRNFLTCFSITCIIANKFKISKNILYQITETDHPVDSSQSFIFSQPSLLLNDIENILQISHNGEIFERGPIESFFLSGLNGHSISAFLSISTSANPLYGELTLSNVILSGLLSHFKVGIYQYFVRAADSLSALNSIFHAIKTSCISSNNILLLHIDAEIRKTLMGEDIFYFENNDPSVNEDYKSLSFTELGMAKKKLIIVSEKIIALPENLKDFIFVFIPINSSFWQFSTTMILYSTEFLFHELYKKFGLKEHKKGKIVNIIRINTQMYHKFITEIVTSAFEDENVRYKWVMECPMGRMLLFNYLMAYFFLSWTEFKSKNLHLRCPIQNLLPYKIFLAHSSVYNFLETLTGIS